MTETCDKKHHVSVFTGTTGKMADTDTIEEEMPEEHSGTESDLEIIEDEDLENNVTTIAELTPEQRAAKAEEYKLEGNEFYKQKNYSQALDLYNQAIELCPKCAAYYGNRAATYMMMSQYNKALDDARTSVSLDPKFVKGHMREGKCHLAMGEHASAIRSYEVALQLEPNNNNVKNELLQAQAVKQYTESAEASYQSGDYRKVVFCMDRCIEYSKECYQFKVIKAESLVLLKRYSEASEIVNDILRLDSMNADAYYVRGLCLYYEDNIDKAFQHFQHVLKLAPDHPKALSVYRKAKRLKAKKEEGNMAFRSGKYQEAYELYTQALSIDPLNVFTNSKLYNNRATVCSKLGKLEEALESCDKAIELDDTYIKAYLRRAKCHTDLEHYEEAVYDYEKVCKLDKTRENKRLLQEAKLELKKSKRKDYYKILGVSKDANDDEIKKAYRKRALLHHPDRHSHDTDAVKKEEEKKFKECGEAYTILSDKKKKMRYDQGHDLEDLDGGGFGGADFDPNIIFQSFFGGGGGPGGGFHQFSSGGHHGAAGGGFPGGFSFQFG